MLNERERERVNISGMCEEKKIRTSERSKKIERERERVSLRS